MKECGGSGRVLLKKLPVIHLERVRQPTETLNQVKVKGEGKVVPVV
jgi:hypothetical protein